jgi:hypothetical protein
MASSVVDELHKLFAHPDFSLPDIVACTRDRIKKVQQRYCLSNAVPAYSL